MSGLRVLRPGIVPYDEALALQRTLADEVRIFPDRSYLLLLSHPPVITIGKNGRAENVLDAGEIPVVRVDRGGDVTYHGPGQVVGYPILSLRAYGIGVRTFVRRLERILIGALDEVGVCAFRRPDSVGVWTRNGKIASIGVRVSRGVTTHGFALQVADDVGPFSRIHPCGLPGTTIASVEKESGRHGGMESVLERHFLRRFDLQCGKYEESRNPTPLQLRHSLPLSAP